MNSRSSKKDYLLNYLDLEFKNKSNEAKNNIQVTTSQYQNQQKQVKQIKYVNQKNQQKNEQDYNSKKSGMLTPASPTPSKVNSSNKKQKNLEYIESLLNSIVNQNTINNERKYAAEQKKIKEKSHNNQHEQEQDQDDIKLEESFLEEKIKETKINKKNQRQVQKIIYTANSKIAQHSLTKERSNKADKLKSELRYLPVNISSDSDSESSDLEYISRTSKHQNDLKRMSSTSSKSEYVTISVQENTDLKSTEDRVGLAQSSDIEFVNSTYLQNLEKQPANIKKDLNLINAKYVDNVQENFDSNLNIFSNFNRSSTVQSQANSSNSNQQNHFQEPSDDEYQGKRIGYNHLYEGTDEDILYDIDNQSNSEEVVVYLHNVKDISDMEKIDDCMDGSSFNSPKHSRSTPDPNFDSRNSFGPISAKKINIIGGIDIIGIKIELQSDQTSSLSEEKHNTDRVHYLNHSPSLNEYLPSLTDRMNRKTTYHEYKYRQGNNTPPDFDKFKKKEQVNEIIEYDMEESRDLEEIEEERKRMMNLFDQQFIEDLKKLRMQTRG